MKKLLAILATLTLTLTACADRHQLITYSELPVQAQTFVQQYFNVADIAHIERERDGLHHEYNVYLQDATEIEFDYQGNLKSIDCRVSPIPEGIVPETILQYVNLHYPNKFVVEYAIGHRRIKIELSNGLELLFDLEGHFLGIED